MKMYRLYMLAGAILAALSVVIGAFGAHALKAGLQAQNRFDAFETAVRYQMYHSIALLVLVLLRPYLKTSLAGAAGVCFLSGIFIFSGSLYILCLSGIGFWGAITPFGGLLLVAAWVLVALGVLLNKNK